MIIDADADEQHLLEQEAGVEVGRVAPAGRAEDHQAAQRPHGDDAADEDEVDVAPGRGRVAGHAPEGAGRDLVAGREGRGGGHQSRTSAPTVGDNESRSSKRPPYGRRGEQGGITQHVEQPARDRGRHRTAVARLLEQDGDGVLGVVGGAEGTEHRGGRLAGDLGGTRLGRDRERVRGEAAEGTDRGAARLGGDAGEAVVEGLAPLRGELDGGQLLGLDRCASAPW